MTERKIDLTHTVSITNAAKDWQRVRIVSDGELLAVLDIRKTSNKSHRMILDVAQRGASLLVNENPE